MTAEEELASLREHVKLIETEKKILAQELIDARRVILALTRRKEAPEPVEQVS